MKSNCHGEKGSGLQVIKRPHFYIVIIIISCFPNTTRWQPCSLKTLSLAGKTTRYSLILGKTDSEVVFKEKVFCKGNNLYPLS